MPKISILWIKWRVWILVKVANYYWHLKRVRRYNDKNKNKDTSSNQSICNDFYFIKFSKEHASRNFIAKFFILGLLSSHPFVVKSWPIWDFSYWISKIESWKLQRNQEMWPTDEKENNWSVAILLCGSSPCCPRRWEDSVTIFTKWQISVYIMCADSQLREKATVFITTCLTDDRRRALMLTKRRNPDWRCFFGSASSKICWFFGKKYFGQSLEKKLLASDFSV